jgi:hypothetical protein
MADKKLTVQVDTLYMLRWTVPDISVTNKFVNPNKSFKAFPDPDPPKSGQTPEDVEITVTKKLKGESKHTPDPFRKNRTAPFVAKTTVTNEKQQKVPVKVFSAVFTARKEGEFIFTVAVPSQNKSDTQTMTVVPKKKRYDTIQEVIDDPKAVRRQAVLAAIAKFFPAFNNSSGLVKGTDSGHLDQGPWVGNYEFNTDQVATSCTVVNPKMMDTSSPAKNNETRWSFNAGPEADVPLDANGKPKPDPRPFKDRGNKAWTFCNKDTIPSVGDTYIVLNKYKQPIYGHVGIILEVPPSGNGLWVTADGGQGAKKAKQQLGIIVPRWGLMGAMLPLGGDPPKNPYPEMKPEDEAGPFLGGGGAGDVKPNKDVPVPAQHDDVAGMQKKISYKVSQGVAGGSNPRRMHGFVDVDSDKLVFDVDGKPTNPAHIKACEDLRDKVQKVIDAYLDGRTLGTPGT